MGFIGRQEWVFGFAIQESVREDETEGERSRAGDGVAVFAPESLDVKDKGGGGGTTFSNFFEFEGVLNLRG
jgi:hypothetical protein